MRVVRGIVIGLAVLLLAGVGLYAVSALWPLSAERRAALAVLDRPPPAPGRNAFAALYLLNHDVPESEWDALVAADVARYRALRPGSMDAFAFMPVADPRWPRLSTRASDSTVSSCDWRKGDCLARVREHREAFAQWLASQSVVAGRAAAIAGYGHYRTPFPPGISAPLPALQGVSLPLVDAALAFVDGRREQAMAATCGHIAGWRPLLAQSDNLLVSVMAAAQVASGAHLLAQMAAELPPGQALPASCASALRPMQVDEIRVCEPMRGEARLGWSAMEAADTEMEGQRLSALFYDAKRTRAINAPLMAWSCGDQAGRAIADDVAAFPPSPPTSLWRLECVSNFIGCALMSVAAPAYGDYQLRAQDVAAQLRLTAAAIWLGENAGSGDEVPAALARLPEALRSAARMPSVSSDGRYLQVPAYDKRNLATLQAPLPAHLRR